MGPIQCSIWNTVGAQETLITQTLSQRCVLPLGADPRDVPWWPRAPGDRAVPLPGTALFLLPCLLGLGCDPHETPPKALQPSLRQLGVSAAPRHWKRPHQVSGLGPTRRGYLWGPSQAPQGL